MLIRQLSRLRGFPKRLLALTLIVLVSPMYSAAEEAPVDKAARQKTAWSTFIQGGYVRQFDTDIDSGGSFGVNRLFVQGGITYRPDHLRSFSLAVGYGYDGYDFGGDSGFGALNPWEDIHTFRVSAPVRWGVNEAWTILAVPTVRVTKENGADTGDATTGGGFAGFSYRVSDGLTIGPGIGASRR